MLREARIKGCVWPAQSLSELATDYSPTRFYIPGDVVKIGQYLATGRVGGAYDMGIWIIVKHGKVLTTTAGVAVQGVNWSSGTPLTSISVDGSPNYRMALRFGNSNPPSTGAAIAAALASVSDVTAGWNLSDMSIAVSAQWAAGGNLPDGGAFSQGSMQGADAYYVCKKAIAANTKNSPASIGAYGQHPLSGTYWEAITAYTAGEGRTDCNAENDFQAVFCGRCGRLL